MLSFMRKNAKSWIVKILFTIIILVFVFFYGYSDMRQGKETALASVGNKKITVGEYQEAYKNMLQFYRNIYQGQLTDEIIRQMGLKQKALENLIDREVLLQEAAKMKLGATIDEVRANIMKTPAFQENNSFSQQNYERTLRYYGISTADFEMNQEKELIIKKIEDLVKSAARVSDKELRDQFLLENEKVAVEYLAINPDMIKETPALPPAEIESYYKKHAEEFRLPAAAKARYILFSPENYESKVTVSPAELKEYYQMDAEQFAEPKKVKARHILLKLGKTDSPEKVAAVQKRAEELLQKIKKGEDFAKLAEKNSEDTGSAAKGGDLGYFKKGDMVKPFEDTAFALKPGEVSSPVKSTFGFHIIKVEDVKEAYTKTFDEVKAIIEKELKQEGSKKIAREEAHRAYNRLFKSKDIAGYAKQNGLKLEETDSFTSGSAPEDATEKNAFSDAAFSINAGEIAPIFALGQKYVLLKLEEKKPSRIPPVVEVTAAIKNILEREKKTQLAKAQAEKVLAALKSGKEEWAAAAKANKGEIKTTKEFSRRGEFIPEIGPARELKETAFTLSEKKPYPDTVFDTEKGVLIIRFKTRQVPGEEEFKKQKDRLQKQLAQMKKDDLFNQFLESLKAKMEITVDKKLLASD
jgi:peptidyl-prolyl cis-trans isomerase D